MTATGAFSSGAGGVGGGGVDWGGGSVFLGCTLRGMLPEERGCRDALVELTQPNFRVGKSNHFLFKVGVLVLSRF